MNLSLSGRLWEIPGGPRASLAEQIRLAASSGYRGMEIRYPQLPSNEEISRTGDLLGANGLEAVMTFQGKIPRSPDEWRDAARVMDVSKALGIRFNRVAVMSEEQLPSVRQLACRGEDLGIQLLLHLHINTWCDSPLRIRRAVEKVNHPSAGVLFDPAHILLADSNDMAGSIQELGSLIRVVNIQNLRPAPDPAEVKGYASSWTRTRAGDPRGLPFGKIAHLLETAGYQGWYNIVAGVAESEDPLVVAQEYMMLFAKNGRTTKEK